MLLGDQAGDNLVLWWFYNRQLTIQRYLTLNFNLTDLCWEQKKIEYTEL